ncbi:MAG: helix-turn-helix transcriptional regulator [Clostridia bacterium]|nr:helix-turn-helix transcriptional regulator [Clostridia bacterium]
MREKDVTPKEMSAKLDIPYTTLLSWMKADNYPRIDKIEAMAEYFGVMKSDLIEEKLTLEKEADADLLAEIFVRMRTDAAYGDLVKYLYNFDTAKCAGIHQMLSAFNEQPSDKLK